MKKNPKTFDAFIFKGELDLLKFRLTELDPFVDVFIIAEFDSDKKNSVYLNNIEMFKKWKKKISHIFINDTDINYSSKIVVEFINFSPGFEDILVISEINEIPDYSKKDEIYELLKYHPVILEHQNFLYNIDHIDNNWISGSVIFTFSSILVRKEIIKETYNKKSNFFGFHTQKLKCGWKLSKFGESDGFNFEEKLPLVGVNRATTYPLVEHDGKISLPKNINLLKYTKLGRERVKKHLFICESKIESIEKLENVYDTVSIIEFSENLNEVICEKITDKVTKSVLYLPNKVLYGNYDLSKFHIQYKLNEINRMVCTVFPQKQDLTKIIFNDSILL
jgi:hypothetical protein